MPGDESLCMQYYRNGTCSKGASCERLHAIYCKVPAHSLLALASSRSTAQTAEAQSIHCTRLVQFASRNLLVQDASGF